MKYRENAQVLENVRIGTDIYSLKLKTEKIAALAKPGQFVSVYTKDSAHLLPRPISVCEADESGVLRLVFRIAGEGTRAFSRLEAGETVRIVGPLGNGFPLDRALERAVKPEGSDTVCGKEKDFFAAGAKKKQVLAIGGGIGIPPILELAKRLVDVTAVLGYRDELFLLDDFPCRTVVATEDGSFGTKGNVLDAIREQNLKADVIYACGPTPMLRALKKYAEEQGIECWLSMEEKMACGIGACLSCVCRSTEVDEHSQVKNKRVCTEGPVFLSTEIEV